MDDLHSRIKSKRIARGLSQAQLAAQTEVSQPTVANWENGSHIPRKNALMRIGQALNVDESWLLSGQEARTQQSVENYLARPIRHIPVYNWPEPGQGLFTHTPEGYMPFSTLIENAFALVDRNDKNIRHRIMIFDPDPEALQAKDKGLWTNGFTAHVDIQNDIPPGSILLGQLKTEIKSY